MLCILSHVKIASLRESGVIVTAQPNPTSGWCNLVVGMEMSPPTTVNFSPTSRQPRAMNLGIQAQLNLLIKVGQEKSRVT